jgi:hypothetical protein
MPAVGTASKPALWKAQPGIADLDMRLENAMRRVSGSIGFDISHDRGRMRTLQETAARSLATGMESGGPWFMRVGQGALDLGTFSPGQGLNLKDVGAEILSEFHTEGTAAFQAARAALYADALAHMQGQEVDEECRNTTLSAADGTFNMPDGDAFTREALPLVRQTAAPATQAGIGALAGVAGLVLLTRMPHLAVIGGLVIGGAVYYMARGRLRVRSEQLLRQLPRKLYHVLAAELKANVRRYEETVNAALKML